MGATVIELNLSSEQYEHLEALARKRHLPVEEAAHLAVAEWLEEQARLEEARHVMRELGQGLGESRPPHDTARRHDTYLYSAEQ